MQLINKESDYAIRALIYLAKNKDKKSSSKEIATNKKIPLPYVRRILSVLSEKKIVTSKEGKQGGFQLLKNPKKLSLKKIIEIFQGKIQLSECLYKGHYCQNRKTCVVRKSVKKIENKMKDEFQKVTLDKLLN
jgi:Rrf2 family protein